jgi:hypothetical protein
VNNQNNQASTNSIASGNNSSNNEIYKIYGKQLRNKIKSNGEKDVTASNGLGYNGKLLPGSIANLSSVNLKVQKSSAASGLSASGSHTSKKAKTDLSQYQLLMSNNNNSSESKQAIAAGGSNTGAMVIVETGQGVKQSHLMAVPNDLPASTTHLTTHDNPLTLPDIQK